MFDEIHIPRRRPDELLTPVGIAELAAHVEDPDDRVVCREAFAFFKEAAGPGRSPTVEQIWQVLDDFDRDEKRALLGILRRRAGLSSLEEEQHKRFQHTYRPVLDDGPTVMLASGALAFQADIEAEERRQQELARSLAARREAEQAQRAPEAEEMRRREAARAEQIRHETPEGVPTP